MSNVKEIVIRGKMNTLALMDVPAEVSEFAAEHLMKGHNISKGQISVIADAARVVKEFLAFAQFPHFGLRISFSGERDTGWNGYGGVIVYYEYEISGQEAVSFEWIEGLIGALESFGTVSMKCYRELD